MEGCPHKKQTTAVQTGSGTAEANAIEGQKAMRGKADSKWFSKQSVEEQENIKLN